MAESHSNKEDNPMPPSSSLKSRHSLRPFVEAAISRESGEWRCPPQRAAVIQGVIFPNILQGR
ncbi:MAG: hypothetical protein RJAPGHWK_001434 [Candidatus Fervidibacter sp.]